MKKVKQIISFEYLFLFLVLSLAIILVLISKTEYSATLYRLSPFIYNSTSIDNRSVMDRAIDSEIVKLKKELVAYKLKLNTLQDLEDENRGLRSTLGLLDSLEMGFTPVKVTNYTTRSYKDKVYAKVETDSIDYVGKPVVGLNGVVGVVESQLENDLTIKLINRAGFKLSVITQINRYPSLSVPKDEITGYLKELTKTREIVVGETLYTSSFGTLFPPNIPVGTIKSYFDDDATIGKKVEFEYIEDLLSLDNLFILESE